MKIKNMSVVAVISLLLVSPLAMANSASTACVGKNAGDSVTFEGSKGNTVHRICRVNKNGKLIPGLTKKQKERRAKRQAKRQEERRAKRQKERQAEKAK